MIIQEVKNISIEFYLKSKGFFPVKSSGKWINYPNPLRVDNKSNFYVNTNENYWIDFARQNNQDSKGDIIDLVQKIEGVSFNQALEYLKTGSFSSFPLSGNSEKEKKKSIEIIKTEPLKHPALFEYLNNRRLNTEIAKEYLSQVTYSIRGKQYFALGFENDKHGYELRNKHIKTLSIAPKWFTTIPAGNNDFDAVNIFEGWPDFIAALTFFNSKATKYDTIVLNGISMVHHININKYQSINAFLDNDTGGQTTLKEIGKTNKPVNNMASIYYPEKKDFNQLIITL